MVPVVSAGAAVEFMDTQLPAVRDCHNFGGVTMTVFAPTDHTSITVHPENGGCGEEHKAGILEPGELFRINCPQCEPVILGMRTGWAATPDGVSLTPDEIGEAERAETNAKRQQTRTWGDPRLIGDAIRDAMLGPGGNAPQQQPSLLAQIAALSSEERAALAGMLLASDDTNTAVGAGASAQLSLEPATQPTGDGGEAPTLGGSDASTPADGAPEKRGPGRPRTRT